MRFIIHNPAIVYLVFSFAILFMGISRVQKNDVIYEIITILFITFVLNVLCLNGLSNIAWYLVVFFIFVPILFSFIVVSPLLFAMFSKKNESKKVKIKK